MIWFLVLLAHVKAQIHCLIRVRESPITYRGKDCLHTVCPRRLTEALSVVFCCALNYFSKRPARGGAARVAALIRGAEEASGREFPVYRIRPVNIPLVCVTKRATCRPSPSKLQYRFVPGSYVSLVFGTSAGNAC